MKVTLLLVMLLLVFSATAVGTISPSLHVQLKTYRFAFNDFCLICGLFSYLQTQVGNVQSNELKTYFRVLTDILV